MNTKKVLIVDDQNISRQLFETIVRDAEGYELLYALSSARVADIYCMKYQVDLVVMDIVMGDGSDGIAAARRIKEISPVTKVILVTSMPEVSYLKKASEAGADSFWYKEEKGMPLLEVMNRTMAGEHIYPDKTPIQQIGNARSDEFTPKELEVLREMTTGASNQEIADKLNISLGTVKSHILHMVQKTGCRNRTELAIEARVRGLVIGDRKD